LHFGPTFGFRVALISDRVIPEENQEIPLHFGGGILVFSIFLILFTFHNLQIAAPYILSIFYCSI
jgi:hypothetical protein